MLTQTRTMIKQIKLGSLARKPITISKMMRKRKMISRSLWLPRTETRKTINKVRKEITQLVEIDLLKMLSSKKMI